nr:hypothetical protein [Tanacetum cinerariifolium]GFA75796.1 hypothetical protein [Tanacetum cinerariifolium]
MKLFKIGTSKKKILDKENVSKQGRDESNRAEELNISDKGSGKTIVFTAVGPFTSADEDIFEDEITTMADTLMAIRRTRPRTTLVVIHDVEEEPRRATPPPIVQSQDKGKGKMVEPKHISKNPIKAQIQRDAEIAQRLFEEEQAQFKREIDVDALLAERLQQKEREQFTVNEKPIMLVDLIAKRKRFFATQRAEQIRNKPSTKAQLINKMVTYLNHMGKYTHNQLKSKSFEEIQMLYEREHKWINDFVHMDSKEVNDSKQLVKERYETTSPEGYDLLLYGDLITLFEPNEEMKYPLIQEMLSRMLNRRLEIDHESEMAFELIRFIKT